MSQDISQISLNSSQHIASVKTSESPVLQQQSRPTNDSRQAKASTADTVKINTEDVVHSERLQRFEDSATDQRILATRARQTDRALDAVSSQVQAMKENLAKIVKNYPPFSIDSKERMEILRSFISLRKEIDSMAIPPPPPEPGVQLKSEIWQEKGLTGLLPQDLSPKASDAQVHSAHDQLESAVRIISEGKQELRQNILAKG